MEVVNESEFESLGRFRTGGVYNPSSQYRRIKITHRVKRVEYDPGRRAVRNDLEILACPDFSSGTEFPFPVFFTVVGLERFQRDTSVHSKGFQC